LARFLFALRRIRSIYSIQLCIAATLGFLIYDTVYVIYRMTDREGHISGARHYINNYVITGEFTSAKAS
jgi:hypothetical protein